MPGGFYVEGRKKGETTQETTNIYNEVSESLHHRGGEFHVVIFFQQIIPVHEYPSLFSLYTDASENLKSYLYPMHNMRLNHGYS